MEYSPLSCIRRQGNGLAFVPNRLVVQIERILKIDGPSVITTGLLAGMVKCGSDSLYVLAG